MEQLQIVLEWMKDNLWTTVAIAAYVVANLAPRPHPSKMQGWQKSFWQIVDRLCLLTSHRVPGSLKFLLLDSPDHGSDGKVEKAPKVPEETEDVDDGDEGKDEPDDEDQDDEPAVVVDTEVQPDEPDEDGAKQEDEGSDSDGKSR